MDDSSVVMMDPVVIDRGVDGDARVLRVVGDVDFSHAERLEFALEEAILDGCGLIVDLSEAGLLDSQMLSALLSGWSKAKDLGTQITLGRVNEHLTRVLQMSGVATEFGLAPLHLTDYRPAPDRSVLNKQNWSIVESVVLAEKELTSALRDLAVESAFEAGLSVAEVRDIRLAVGEALVNAFTHGSEGPESKIWLRCMSCTHAFVAEVVDSGIRGAPAPSFTSAGSTGLGLRLMRAAVDEVELFPSPTGTRVRMLKWVNRGPGGACA